MVINIKKRTMWNSNSVDLTTETAKDTKVDALPGF